MNKAEELNKKIFELLETFDTTKLLNYAQKLENEGGKKYQYWEELTQNVVTSERGKVDCYFYHYIACLTKYLKPRQVVEIGADIGVSASVFLTEIPERSKIFSCDIKDDWEIVSKDSRLIKIVGDGKVMGTWEGKLDLSKTNILFIDGDHNSDQVKGELKIFLPHLKLRTVILFDDLNAIREAFDQLTIDKTEDMRIHGNNFGIAIV